MCLINKWLLHIKTQEGFNQTTALVTIAALIGTLVTLVFTLSQNRLDQRAWVSVKSVKLSSPFSESQEGKVSIGVANSGKTPALNVRIIKAGIGNQPNPPLALINLQRMVLSPGSAEDIIFITIPKYSPMQMLHLKFTIEYEDIFGRTHSTTFCGYYPTSQPPFFFNEPDSCNDMN